MRCFRTRFDSQHVKAPQILVNYLWERFYHVFSSFSGNLISKMCPLVLDEVSGVFDCKVSRILAKSSREHFYHVFSSFWGKLIWKMSPLMLGEISGGFVNTYTADDKYPVQDCENLQLPIQMQLSEKRETFSEFFLPFFASTSNFNHFGRKDDRHS